MSGVLGPSNNGFIYNYVKCKVIKIIHRKEERTGLDDGEGEFKS